MLIWSLLPFQIGNAESISVYEMSGDLWIRHRSVLSSASHYSLIQWKSLSKPDMVFRCITAISFCIRMAMFHISDFNLTVDTFGIRVLNLLSRALQQ